MVWNAGLVTLIGALVIMGITWWLISSTKSTAAAEQVAPKVYGMRKLYFFLLAIVIVVTLYATLHGGLPYYPPSDAKPDYTVSVQGQMWSWQITEMRDNAQELPATEIVSGKVVEFVVSTTDVNHGIGIYNEAGQLVTQTQAMPGYPAKIYHTFAQPGTYQIVCMEYCGSGHQVMNTSFSVK